MSTSNVLTKSYRNRYTSRGMRDLGRFQVIGAAAAILFTRLVAADDWPYYQHDASHTGDSSALVNPQALSLTWTAPSSPTGYSTPVIVGNTIYAMQNQGGSVSRRRRLARSTFRLVQLIGVIPATLCSRRSQALAAGLLHLSGPLFQVHRSMCWMQ